MWPFKPKPLTLETAFDKIEKTIEKYDWTQGSFARDKHGEWTDVKSKEAVSFCSVGYIRRVLDTNDSNECKIYETIRAALDEVASENSSGHSVLNYNDAVAKSKDDIKLLFKEARKHVAV